MHSLNQNKNEDRTAGIIMKILRERRNLSYEDLSSKLDGVSTKQIIDLENGVLPMSIEMARRIANILDVPVFLFLK